MRELSFVGFSQVTRHRGCGRWTWLALSILGVALTFVQINDTFLKFSVHPVKTKV